MHLQVISASAIAPGAAGAAGVVFTGDSLTVSNGDERAGIDIVSIWQTNQVAGFGQITFPSAHDTTRGYRAGAAIGVNPAVLPLGIQMPVKAQELLTWLIAGSAVAGDVEQISMLIRYGNLPGINARYITAQQLHDRAHKLTTIEQSITSVAGPGYSGEVVLNTSSDLLLANRDYAVTGLTCRTQVHAITMRGPDIGNVRIATPGMLRQEIGSQFFKLQSNALREPLIPVINSGNKTSTFLGVATDENAGTFVVTAHMVLLK